MRISWLLALTTTFLATPADVAHGKDGLEQMVDQDYVLALATVDRFMYAWMMRDQERGLELLSPKLKGQFSQEDFRFYISGISNPHHAAFEVCVGTKLAPGRFAFEVRFYGHYTGEKESTRRPEPLKIGVIQTGPEQWLVDALPGLATKP